MQPKRIRPMSWDIAMHGEVKLNIDNQVSWQYYGNGSLSTRSVKIKTIAEWLGFNGESQFGTYRCPEQVTELTKLQYELNTSYHFENFTEDQQVIVLNSKDIFNLEYKILNEMDNIIYPGILSSCFFMGIIGPLFGNNWRSLEEFPADMPPHLKDVRIFVWFS